MILIEAIDKIKKAAKTLQRLEGAVRHTLEPPGVEGRQIPIVFTQSFTFKPQQATSLTPLPVPLDVVQATIVNGSEDCRLYSATYSAYAIPTSQPQDEVVPPVELFDFPNCMSPSVPSGGNPRYSYLNDVAFDFQWNVQLLSVQANYLSQANNAQFLSRRSLGHPDKAVRRNLFGGKLFKAGDALLLSAKPIFFGPHPMGSNIYYPVINHPDIMLTISIFGTRGPDMVELPEDEDLDP